MTHGPGQDAGGDANGHDEPDWPGLAHPRMRDELLDYLDGLSDLDYQQKVWVRREAHPGVKHDELDYAIHFLFDDTGLARAPQASIGAFLFDEAEARAVQDVTRALDAVLDQYGTALTDAAYLAKPEWQHVVDAAQSALQALKQPEIRIDGQPVIVPTNGTLRAILNDPRYLDRLVYTPGTRPPIAHLITFVLDHANRFSLGLHRVKHPAHLWMPVALMRPHGHWQRVHIEYPACATCGWRGPIANPTEPSLYFGVPEERQALARAWALPRTGCPDCGAALGRPAIWAGAAGKPGST